MASTESKRLASCSACKEVKPQLLLVDDNFYCIECKAETMKEDIAISKIKLEVDVNDETVVQSENDFRQFVEPVVETASDAAAIKWNRVSLVEVKEECFQIKEEKYESDIEDYEFPSESNDTVEASLSGSEFKTQEKQYQDKSEPAERGTTVDTHCENYENVKIKDEITMEETRVNVEDGYGNDKLRCKHCGLDFDTDGELTSHMQKHYSKAKVHYCMVCSFVSKRPALFREHLQKQHGGFDSKCKFCHELYHSGESEVHESQCLGRLLFQCKSCSEHYGKREGLLKHLDEHGIAEDDKHLSIVEYRIKRPFYSCSTCDDEKAYEEGQYWEHIKNIHQGHHLQCKHCPKTFRTRSDLFDHMDEKCKDVENANKEFKCPNCLKSYKSKASVLNHIRNEHRSVNQECPKCFKLFKNQAAVDSHLRYFHQPTTCKICNIEFATKTSFIHHKYTQHSEQSASAKSQCPECHKILLTERNLKIHIKMLHTPAKENLEVKCPHCDRTFRNNFCLNSHIRRQHQSATCNICKIEFKALSHYKYHKATKHRESMKCPSCPRTFHFLSKYRLHIETHEIEKETKQDSTGQPVEETTSKASTSQRRKNKVPKPELKCSDCSKVLKSQRSLTNHMLTQHQLSSKEQEVKCPHCHKMVKNKNSLNSHIQTQHQGATCTICEIDFKTGAQYKYHKMKKHDAPLKCPVCEKKFFASHKYQEHLKSHADEKTI